MAMKYNNNICKWRWIPLLFALLMVANHASGQNFIREETAYTSDDHSLIRSVSDTDWIVYSHSGYNECFRVTNSSTVVPFFSLCNDEDYEINDFEIFHDTVFFCGCLHDTTDYAMFGMFPLAGFPSTTVKYKVFTGLKSFTKIAMFSSAGTTHAALTAIYHRGFGTMVDIIKQSASSWLFCVADRSSYFESYDDVVALSEYVVFSSRNMKTSPFVKRLAQFVYHSIPTTPGNTFLSVNPAVKVVRTMEVKSPIVMNAWANNAFNTANTASASKISVGQFVGTNYLGSSETPSQSGLAIRELGFNLFNMETELLVNVQNANTNGSLIYHFETANFLNNTVLYAHNYADQFLYSLSDAGLFDLLQVSCGHHASNNRLRVYRYKYTLYDCALRETLSSECVDYGVNDDFLTVSIDAYPKTLDELQSKGSVTNFRRICPSKDDETEQ